MPLQIKLTRRQLALIILTAAGGSAAAVKLIRRDDTAVELGLPSPADPNNPPFEVFEALCWIALARTKLDVKLVRRMYEIFMEEPWGPKHIGHAYATLYEALAHTGEKLEERREPPPVSRLGSGERWFVSHLVTTWYLGIYYHEQRPTRRITRSGALMYAALRGLAPVPYTESSGYGAWAVPPSNHGDRDP